MTMRHTLRLAVLLCLLLAGAGTLAPAAAAPATSHDSCRFYPQSGGYGVCNDGEARFLAALTDWGIEAIGYPISERYARDGFVTQAFQKGIMQWRPENQSVSLVNVFDDLHLAGLDQALLERYQTPAPLPDGWDGGRPFSQVIERRQSLLASRPALQRAYFAAGDPLTFFGLPTSRVEDMGNHYAIRLQRAVLQEWKEAVPWAAAGEVTIANGGQIARDLGLLPDVALVVPDAATLRARYDWVRVEALRARAYGTEGAIERIRVMERPAGFTRYLISYPSDGLTIGGFMNIPTGRGPFPVILVNHGYMPTDSYETLTYTTKYADALARAGYLVLHPNYRNHRGSDYGVDAFRAGYAIDVLNLLELAKRLPEARPEAIGMWGHSMGGGITLRALTVTDDVRAALVYGSMSADEIETIERRRERWGPAAEVTRRGYPLTPEEDPAFYAAISPINYLQYVTAPIAIHHGVLDDSVPYRWSERLRDELTAAGKPVDFFAYPDQPHNFYGAGYDLLMARTIAFFDRELK